MVKGFCNQKDEFPFPIRNHNCENQRNVGQAISDAECHSGTQSFHYKRGQAGSSHGSGSPFGPSLIYRSGRSDENYKADTDGFYVRLWVKAANALGDDSTFEVNGADNLGTDRTTGMLFIKTEPTGIHFWTHIAGDLEGQGHCKLFRNCSDTWPTLTIANHLSLSVWHKVEMTFRSYSGNYRDEWIYKVDEEPQVNVKSYLQAWRFEKKHNYRYVDRIRVRNRHDPADDTFKGLYFDDIYYKVFNWSKPELVLDEYYTSFEP